MSSSGGGIVRAGNASDAEGVRGFRRLWVSGVAVVTVATSDGFRGVTISGLLPLSVEPPGIAIGLQADAGFHRLLGAGTSIGVSILDRAQEFLAERFAGRAPVPDGRFSGVSHRIEDAVPVIDGSIAWCVATVTGIQEHGDHRLVICEVVRIGFLDDRDDPMVLFRTQYRDLEYR